MTTAAAAAVVRWQERSIGLLHSHPTPYPPHRTAYAVTHLSTASGKDDWEQTFNVSRLVQTFRRACLRRRIMSDPTYTLIQQRSHAKLAATGFASKRHKSTVSAAGKVEGFADRVERALECYDCDKYDPAQ